MNILFVHQNFPGQFKFLAPALVARGLARGLARLVAVAKRGDAECGGAVHALPGS